MPPMLMLTLTLTLTLTLILIPILILMPAVAMSVAPILTMAGLGGLRIFRGSHGGRRAILARFTVRRLVH
jgi:hypothetical protein